MKVIIADDHPVFRRGIISALKNKSLISKLAEAANGEEVLHLLHKEHYDIVLMDIQMKTMDGLKATKLVHKNHPKTKIVALSMLEDSKIILEMMNNGASGFLTKNADIDEILEAIQVVCSGKDYFSKDASSSLLSNFSELKNMQLAQANSENLFDEREREIAFLLCKGKKNKEIGEIVSLSVRTIEYHRGKIYELVKAKNISELKANVSTEIQNDENLLKKFEKYLKWE